MFESVTVLNIKYSMIKIRKTNTIIFTLITNEPFVEIFQTAIVIYASCILTIKVINFADNLLVFIKMYNMEINYFLRIQSHNLKKQLLIEQTTSLFLNTVFSIIDIV